MCLSERSLPSLPGSSNQESGENIRKRKKLPMQGVAKNNVQSLLQISGSATSGASLDPSTIPKAYTKSGGSGGRGRGKVSTFNKVASRGGGLILAPRDKSSAQQQVAPGTNSC